MASIRQVKFRWDNPDNAAITKYQYKQWIDGDTEPFGWFNFAGTISAQSVSVRGLRDGVKYHFRIRAVAAGNVTGAPSDVITVTPGPIPTAPTARPNVTVVPPVPGDRQITLNWSNPNNTDIIKYQIRRRDVRTAQDGSKTGDWNDWGDIPGSDKDTISHVVTGLPTGVKYYFRIRAVAGDYAHGPAAYGPASTVTVVKLVAAPPVQAAPTKISAQARYKQIELIWRDPNLSDQKDTTITKYQIRQWTGSSETGDWRDISATISTTLIEYRVTGLTNSVTYSFRIRGLTNGVVVTESNVVRATPVAAPPRSPTRPKVVAGDGEIALSWNNPNNADITKYQIRQWTGGGERGSWGNWVDINPSDKDTVRYGVTGLTNGVEYSFRIRAVAGSVTGSQSPYTAVVIPMVVPGKPDLSASTGDGEVTLSWSDPNNPVITKYQYKQWTGNTEPNPGNWVDISGSGKDPITHTVTGLTNGTIYRFRIRAVAGSVTGVESDFVVVTLTGLVTIMGTMTQGQTLTADTSTIVDPDGPSNLTFTYQWKRDGTAISGANQASYTLTQADVGSAISVTVSWTDDGGTAETLTSATTANVANLNDSPTGAVTITGTATQGQTLTAVTSAISDPDGPASLTFSYQWKRGGTDISGATSRTYVLKQADVGSVITVVVSWTDSGSIVETLTSAATANVANLNDSPTGSVTITGTATQGQTLTAVTSAISDPDGPSNLVFSYQWKRGGTDISGATSNTYVLTQADVGSAITVVVSWTDGGGTAESLTSVATASVTNANDPPTGAVTITGTATQGQTLTADTSGVSDPDGPSSLTFSYQWKRGGTDISGATSNTYVLKQADVGSAITVVVSWTDSGGAAETLTSTATASVTNANDPPTGSVTITGTPNQGQTLTADTSGISDPDGPSSLTFSYQWKRGGTDISGATSSTYVLTQADVGSVITVTVSWTDSGSTVETLTSAATASVANVNDSPTGAVTITGTATQGQTLTADTSTIVDPDGPSNLTFSYQWKRGGTDISGATSSTYILTQADVGAAITVTVSWTDGGGTAETLTSAATASVANVNDLPTGAVTITGTATQGQTLTADTSTIVDPDGPSNLTFSYQWKRGGTDISGATSSTYILTQADVGSVITVVVSWTDAGGTSESLTSAATASVANVNDLPTGAVTITGTATQGQTLTADTGTIVDPDGPSSLTFSYQWKRGGTDINGATSSTYIMTQADVGSVITVVVSWTDSGSTVESLTSAATASVANVNDSPTGAVTITGTATQGQTLTADTGTIVDPDGPSNLTFSYQWKRGGTDISGATTSTYVLTQADVGSVITVVVSWTDAGGASESLTSTATAKVINISGADSGTIIDVVEDGGRSIITATVDETAVKLTLPSGHGVTEIEFSPAAPTVTEPSGVSFGGKPSYVDIDLDVELSSSSSAIVCLEEPEELSGNLSVYHLADVEGAGWRKLPSPASVPSGYVCGKTSSFSTFVLGSPKPTFGSESIGDYVWTVGVEVVDVVLPEATGGDGVITYSLRPSLPLDLKFNDDSPRAITGKPTEALAKTKFTYKAEDVDGDTSELSFSITVRAAEEKERARVLSVVLASFGRAAATGAVDVIGERFVSSSSLAGSPKLTLGGVSMTSFDTRSVAGAVDGVLGLSGGSDIELLEGLDLEPVELRRVSGRDLFAQSEFSIPLSSSGDDMGGVMRGWTLWGSGAGSGFSGSNLDGDIDTEGELYTGYMGLDYRFGNRGLAGVAISRSVGEVEYEVDGSFYLMSGETGSIRGEVDLELTSVLPYAHYTIRPGLSIWGLVGGGIGEVELKDAAGEVEADVNMLMVALGVRQELARWGDIDFGLKSDGFAVQLKTEGVEGLSGVSGVARRLRLGLEMSRDVYVTGDSLLLPSVEIGGRWDGGDADSGVGMEVGGGIEYVHRGLGLSVEVRGRYLLFHEESEFEDWGGSFSLRMGDGVRGRGLWLMFEPEWGEVASGVERMWRGEVESGLGVGKRGLSSGRVKFDVGYGMETRGSGWLVTPYSGISIMGEGEREYRLGGKVGVGEWMDISLEGERREVSSGVVDHGILLWWKLLL